MSAKDALLVGRGFSAVLLRGWILVVGLAIAVVLLQEEVRTGTFVLLSPVVLASVYAPASPAPAGVVVVAAGLLVFDGGDPLRAGVLALIPLIHLFHVSCGIAGAIPVTGRVHLAALAAPARRFLLVQALTAVAVTVAAVVPTARTSPLVEALALVGLAGLAFAVVWLQRVS